MGTLSYFLGCSSPEGFSSFFGEMCPAHSGGYTYIIKGGPGTGKSSLMKRINLLLADAEIETQLIYCSSDPDSLDGVYAPSLGCWIADGTAPHTLEPKYPGAAQEIVDLGAFWDKSVLRSRADEVIALTDENAALHRRCRRFLEASSLLREDILRLTVGCIDTDKLKRTASRIAAREFGSPGEKIGEEHHRLLSAVTPKGVMFFDSTVRELCERVYVIEDENGAAAAALLSLLRGYALAGGYDVISSPCPLAPDGDPEHLIVPEKRIGFVTSNRFHTAEFESAVKISSARFTDRTALRRRSSRLSFTKKAYGEFVDEAVESLRQAKGVHDELESIYVSAMGFSRMDALAVKLAADMLERGERTQE